MSAEPDLPKLHVVGGAATHHDGGPTHHLKKLSEADTTQLTQATVTNRAVVVKPGYLRDVFVDLDIPTTIRLRPVVDPAVVEEPTESRSLTRDESTGLYVLLGVFVGSWVLAGIFAPRPPKEPAQDSPIEDKH